MSLFKKMISKIKSCCSVVGKSLYKFIMLGDIPETSTTTSTPEVPNTTEVKTEVEPVKNIGLYPDAPLPLVIEGANKFAAKLDCAIISYIRKQISFGSDIGDFAKMYKVTTTTIQKALDCKSYKKCCEK